MAFLCIFIAKILLISLACPYNGGTVGGYPGCLNNWKLIDGKICSDTCPSMFIDNMQHGVVPSCSLNNVEAGVLFEMYFANVNDLTATYIASSLDSSTQFQNPNSVAYNSQTQTSPLPTIDRGFYFATTSSITCNKSFIPGDYFMLNMWIKPLANGEILNVISSATSYMKLWADISGRYKFSLKIYDTNNNVQAEQIMTFTAIYSTLWNRASIVISQLDCSNANVNLLINGSNVGSIALSNSEFRFPTLSYTWTIGNIGSENSFRGFIYWLKIRANGGLNTAPSTVTINCIENQYWDTSISSCQNCNPNCSTWFWCVKASDCLPCDIVDCITCQGYPPLACISCTTGVPPNCCDYLATACIQTWTNTACDAGYFLVGGICLYACPCGFGNCAAVSTAVLTADFTGAFSGSYGTDLITGISSASYNYWSSPETEDPFPAKNRGLYFNSNQFLSGSINLSNTWSMAMWVYVISGTIISHSSSKLTVDSSGTITFYLEKWDGSVSPTSYSASNSITTSTWAYISYSVGFANKATTMTPYINKIAGTAISITDYVFRLPAGGILYVGKGFPNFNGFIAYFILWQVSITDFSAYYSISTLTGGLVSSLWSCDYSHYYDGSIYKSCLTSCTNGCTRDTSCHICDDFLCHQCSSFESGACILCISNASGSPCACNSGFYQPINQALCSVCYNGCTHCTGDSYHLCTSCSSSYYFYNNIICLSECPTGYTENTNTGNCDLSETIPLSLPLVNQILLDHINGTQVGSSFTNTYPTYDSNDPIPAYLRGYYFNSNSYITTTLMLAPNFSAALWIKAASSGMVLTKYSSSTTKWFLQILSSGYLKFVLHLIDTSTITVTGSSNVFNSWYFVWFDCKINSDGTTTISSYIDIASQGTSTSSSALFLLDSKTGNFNIGLNSGGFSGFFWKLKIFSQNDNFLFYYQTVGCSGGCLKCPIDLSCPNDCPLTQYYNGFSCSNCISLCTKGCRSSDTCRLCKTKECATCTAFTGANSCLTCINNAISDGNGGCTCAANAFWVSSTETCDICDNACSICLKTTYFECSTCLGGYQKVGTACLNECPYGTSCLTVTTTVIDQSFDADFQGSYGIFITGTSAATYQFYSSPEIVDPIPAYKRGLYFDGTMYLLSSVPVNFSHSFSIGVWLYVLINGDLLEKQTFLTMTSTGAITATMIDPQLATSSQTLSPSSSFSGWCYLSVTFEYSLDSTTLTIYINGVSSSTATVTNKIYRDQASTYLMLGKSSNLGFKGFLYYFQLWNTPISGFSAIISSFTFCGQGNGASCLWTCGISSYIDGASTSSCSSCSYGCRRVGSCNICDDTLCIACNGFDSGKCTQCTENAINPDSCICDINHVLDPSNNNTCILIKAGGFRGEDGKFYLCPDLCDTCDSSINCNSCVENASVNNGLCYCNLGYSGTKNCTLSLFSANLTVFSDNSLYLKFSESLAKSLTSNDFTITIENQGKISFKMEELNSTCYYISLNIAKAISKGTLATLEFLNITEIRSVSNGILNSSVISASLNSYDPEPISAGMEAISSQAAVGVQIAVSGVLALSIINPSPSSLWSMMNTLQILSYLTLSGIPFSNRMRTFLNNLNSFDFFPNVFAYIIDKNEGNAPYSQAKDFGYDTDLVLINTGNDFALIIASLSVLPIILFFSRCSYRWLGKKFMKTLKAYQFAFYLRFWIQCYLELGATASIGLVALGYKNITQIANLITCVAIYMLLVATPPLFFWFSYKNKNRIQSREKKITALFSSFFYEFRINRGFLATQYYFVFFIRRLVYIVNLIYLRDYPQTEVTINVVLSLMTIMHLFFCWPFEDSILQISNLLTEIMIGLIMISTSVYLFNVEEKIASIIENAIVGIVIGAIVIQAFSSIAIFARTLYGIIYDKLSKAGIVRSSVKPLNKHIKKAKKINL